MRVACFLVLFVFGGCSSGFFQSTSDREQHIHALVESVSEKGPLILSDTNPYLAPNQLLHLLEEESPTVSGFIETVGAPDALVVSSDSTPPNQIQLLYLHRDESYVVAENDGTWLVIGPRDFPSAHRVVVKRGVRNRKSDPILASNHEEENREERSGAHHPSQDYDVVTSKLEGDLLSKLQDIRKAHHGPRIDHNNRRDVKHIVLTSEETLAVISLWYTDSPLNADRIARMNGIAPLTRLAPGQTFIIPKYLSKTGSGLPPSAIEELKKLIEEASKDEASS
ncbi:MAG: hypothetical protein KDD60_04835 [Bdellovibrionales bacterium]|nr:hypothetical protein [Bdellovibrionales bacterium]